MLMVGVSVPFSFLRGRDMRRVWMRAIVLFLLGSLRTSLHGRPELMELSSALQPIAVAYLAACYLTVRSRRVQIAAAVLILLAHGLVLALVPAPGVPAASYEKGHNVVASVDLAVLGRTHAEGWGTVLTTAPTISTTILGLIFGQLLLAGCPHLRFTTVVLITGTACLAAGFALSPIIPIIMKLWTVTYALASMGWACLIFAAFYWIIDARGYRRWAFVLTVIGMNALAAYLGPSIVPVQRIAGIFTNPIAQHIGAYGRVISTGAVLLINWAVLFWMYRRKIFLRP